MKRPLGIWLVEIYATLNFIVAVFGFWFILSGRLQAADAQDAKLLKSFHIFDYILSIVMHVSVVLGAIFLFQLRKLSLVFFQTTFGLNLVANIWQAATHRFMAGIGGPSISGWISLIMSWAIVLSIIFYISKLRKKGVLS